LKTQRDVICQNVYDESPYTFHIPSSSISLTTAIKRNATENLYMVAILLFYVLQKYLFKKGCMFLEDYCHT